jgi:hypothetical protein
MSQKHRIGHLRRILTIETLEDRTLLSSNVLISESPSGVLSITGDNGKNDYNINQTNNLGSPTLSVTGIRTAINGVPNGTYNAPLTGPNAVKEIDISEGNGSKTVNLGNTAGFSIPGNIQIDTGSGSDHFSLKNIGAAILSFNGGNGSHTVSYDTVQAQKSFITTGAGNAKISQAHATIASDDEIVTGGGSANVSINYCTIGGPPGLKISVGNGDDPTINVDNSTFAQADITAGTETPGATSSNAVDVSADTITGDHLNISLLNESGVSGVLLSGAAGIRPGSVNTLTMNNDLFTEATGPGNLNVRVDDGDPYFNGVSITAASSVKMTAISTTGNVNVMLGDHFQVVQLGTGIVDATEIVAKNLTLSVESDVDTVLVTAQTSQNENITVGNVSTYPIPPLPAPSSLVNGTVGGNLNVTIGSNSNPNLVNGWPLTIGGTTAMAEEHVTGNLTIVAGNGLAITIEGSDATSIGTTTDITMGNGSTNQHESLMLTNVNSGTDPTIHIDSNPGDQVIIDLTNVQCLAGDPNLIIIDSGHGVDHVNLTDVTVTGFLQITLSNSGQNVVTSENVTVGDVADSFINGGGGNSVYNDLGGNSLPDTNPPLIGFENIPPGPSIG